MKCVLDLTQEIEFLGLIVNSQFMILSLPAEKIGKIKDHSLRLLKVSLLDLTKLIETLSLTIHVVLPVRLRTTTANGISEANTASPHFHKALPWQRRSCYEGTSNLELCNGRLDIQPLAHILIQTDASNEGWRAVCQGIRTGQ